MAVAGAHRVSGGLGPMREALGAVQASGPLGLCLSPGWLARARRRSRG